MAKGSLPPADEAEAAMLTRGEIAKDSTPTVTPWSRRREGALYEASIPPK